MNLATLTKRIVPLLSRHSFVKRGNAFHRPMGDNVVSLALNRSSRSSPDALIVAVEMGVTVGALAKLQGCEITLQSADWDYASRMTSSSGDEWWTIREQDSTLEHFERALEDTCVTQLEELADGQRLRDIFLADRKRTGLSGPRLQVLIALLAEHGPLEELPGALNELASLKYAAARGQADRLAAALRQRGIHV